MPHWGNDLSADFQQTANIVTRSAGAFMVHKRAFLILSRLKSYSFRGLDVHCHLKEPSGQANANSQFPCQVVIAK